MLREVWRGRLWSARPATVVTDRDDLVMFFVPVGSTALLPYTPDGRPLHAFVDAGVWELRPTTWQDTNVLSFAEPGRPNATMAFWDASWSFVGWYLNVQTPLERTTVGFDYLDQELDAWIGADGSWTWKDEDELERSVAAGVWSPGDAERFRREAEAGIRRLLERRPPFDRDWRSWRPDPAWVTPVLPERERLE